MIVLKKLDNIILFFFLIGIILITIDGLPWFKYSNYSPTSIFPLFISFLLILMSGIKLKNLDYFLIIFVFLSIIHSLLAGIYYNEYTSAYKHVISICTGIFIYISSLYSGELISKNLLAQRKLYTSLVIALLFPIFLGFLQAINAFTGMFGFISNITALFADPYINRIQMTSDEPSFASVHLLFGMVILVLFFNKYRFSKKLFILCSILFFLTFSFYGYGVLIFALLLFGLFDRKYRLKILISILGIIIVMFGLIPIIIEYYNIQSYYVERFKISNLNLNYWLYTDISSFVRFVFPFIGLLQFINNPFFGVGGGYYYVDFAKYILSYFPDQLSFPEVYYNTIVEPSNANPRNLLIKVLSEEGFIIGFFFLSFIFILYKKIKKQSYAKFVFFLAIAMTLNFDSYAQVDFWILIGLLRSGLFEYDRKNIESRSLK